MRKYNEWDIDEKIHPKQAKKSKDINIKYRKPIYEYEALVKEVSYEYDEQQLHEVSWL